MLNIFFLWCETVTIKVIHGLTKELVLDVDKVLGIFDTTQVCVLDRSLHVDALGPECAASQDLHLLRAGPSRFIASADKLSLGGQELHVRLLHALLALDKVPALDKMAGNIACRFASHADRHIVPGHASKKLLLDQVVVVVLD